MARKNSKKRKRKNPEELDKARSELLREQPNILSSAWEAGKTPGSFAQEEWHSEHRFPSLQEVASGDRMAGASLPLNAFGPAPGTQARMKPEERSVQAYMACMADVYHATRKQEATKEQRGQASMVWSELQRARIFHIEPSTYTALHIESDRHTTEEAGLDYRPTGVEQTVTKEESQHHLHRVSRASRRLGYPDKMSFPTMFIGYGEGCPLSPTTALYKAPSSLRDNLAGLRVRGHLMTLDGFVVEFLMGVTTSGQGLTWFDIIRHEASWQYSMDLTPWILTGIIKIINDHRTFVVETNLPTDMRKEFKRNRKGMGLDGKGKKRGHVPPPYYTLRIHSKVIQEQVKKAFPHPRAPASYRTDVRGHERCRIKRGPMPIDAELAAKLKKRDYKLYTTNELDAETYRRLSERNMAYKRADEWMAIKVSWVNDYMSNNDASLPYVPAVRKLSDVSVKPQRTPTGSWADNPGS